jgi:hypothetical protein
MLFKNPFPYALVLWLGVVNIINAADEVPLNKDVTEYLKKYCVACHGAEMPKAGLGLHRFADELAVLKERKAWDNVQVMIDAGDMPPKDKPQPTADETTIFLAAIKGIFERSAKNGKVDPGRVTARRLNRNEYNNTSRDLIGIDLRPAEDFPADDVGHGFDNIGDVLTLSDVLMERYLTAAEGIVEKAIALDPPKSPDRGQSSRYLEPAGPGIPDQPNREVDAAKTTPTESGPLHTPYKLGDSGEYIFRLNAYREGDQPVKVAILLHAKDLPNPATEEETKKLTGAALKALMPFRILAIEELKAKDDKGRKPLEVKFQIEQPGDYRVAAALVTAEKEGDPAPKMFVGTFHLIGPTDTRPVFHRTMLAGLDNKTPEEKTRNILNRCASRAFRRPATTAELDRYVKLVEQTTASGKRWEEGIQFAMQAVLISPKFLFRLELDDSPSAKDIRPLNEFQLAARLSYFLWATMPDEELFQLATRGELKKNLEPQIRRMLRDPKAKTLVENFALQWLQIGRIKQFQADQQLFPQFDEPLKMAMLQETELFLEELIREDRSILNLVDADYTYLNEPLARLYGITDTAGNLSGQKATKPGQPLRGKQFVRVSLQGNQRGGLLTQASILTVTSNPTRTSPVKRGKWVLEQILGTPPPPPPGAVPELDDAKRMLTGTLRERMQQHRENPACANCHAKMDPIGFAFENYDAIGRYREKDGEGKIDPSGVLPDGKTFQGPQELKEILKAKKQLVARCLAEKLLTYALGRGLEYYDAPAIDKIVQRIETEDYKFSAVVLGIVNSDPFISRRGSE